MTEVHAPASPSSLRDLVRLIDTVAESDYFLEQLRNRVGNDDARFPLNAFLTATRNIGPMLTALMRSEPEFSAWYSARMSSVSEEVLAGLIPLRREWMDRPESNVWLLCASHLRDILAVVSEGFRRFGVQSDARGLFTRETISAWRCSIEDVEAELGYPRGWTDVFPDHEDPAAERLKMLAADTYAGDLGVFLSKYQLA